MNKHTKSFWGWKDTILLFIALIPLIVGFVVYDKLPVQMASHYDLSGHVNGYMNKTGFFIMMACVNLFLMFTLKVVPQIDPRANNYAKFTDVYELFRFVISLFMSSIFIMVLLNNVGYDISMNTVLLMSLGILWTVFGNYLGRIRSNFTLGIRTPWTLANQEVWNRTHRFAAPLWVICGVIMIVSAFMDSGYTLYILLAALVLSVLLPIVYSYSLFHKLERGKDQ
ncbi:SdpI family protein [Paenibacillus hexagrammi]|uniref:SdpI family protein n=1 Tax=Paenibacillus hexagrammi TaxID=2908839 RepID=A0ABY3SDW5_9BACL|nr:SdpI family protein [Paenibacillus sp. YPD9-1]UJF32027.1 SdpI family protein [Paenibacillus sp. YPD9-1]